MLTAKQVEALPPDLQPAAPPPPPPTGQPWDDCLPPGFSVTTKPDGALTLIHSTIVETTDATGARVMTPLHIPVAQSVFWLANWADSESDEDRAQAVLCRWNRKDRLVQRWPMDQSVTASRTDLLKELASRGIVVGSHKRSGASVDEYMKAQLQRIESLGRRPKVMERFGLRVLPDGKLVCAQGKYVIFPDGTIQEGMVSKPLAKSVDKYPISPLPPNDLGEWDATVWDTHIKPAAQKYVQFLHDNYDAPDQARFRLAIMLGLSSPLMPFVDGGYFSGLALPPNGLTVSLYSRNTARGKTATIKSMMIAFGNASQLVTSGDKAGSTDNAHIVRMVQAGTMPNSMEEMGNNSEASVTQLISSASNGFSKSRATQDGGLNASKAWALINFVTTNRAQRDMIAATQEESSAIQYRLLELNCDGIADRDNNTAFGEAFKDINRECAGALGAVLHRAICRAGVEAMNKVVSRSISDAAKLLKAGQSARFQFRALGAMIVTYHLLRREGIALFDLQELINEFRTAHDGAVEYVRENVLPTNGLELLQIMLTDLKPATLITDNETNRGKDRTAYDIPLNARVPDKVSARHIVSLGITYVATSAVREWCIEKKVNERDMLGDCKAAGILVAPYRTKPGVFTMQLDLFKGTKEESTVFTRCLKVNVRALRNQTGYNDGADIPPANVAPIGIKPKPTPPAPVDTKEQSQ